MSVWWFCDFERGSSMQHAAVIERNYVTRHHFVLYLIGRVSQHSTNSEVTRVQLNGFLRWSKHDGITHVIVESKSDNLFIPVQPVKKKKWKRSILSHEDKDGHTIIQCKAFFHSFWSEKEWLALIFQPTSWPLLFFERFSSTLEHYRKLVWYSRWFLLPLLLHT